MKFVLLFVGLRCTACYYEKKIKLLSEKKNERGKRTFSISCPRIQFNPIFLVEKSNLLHLFIVCRQYFFLYFSSCNHLEHSTDGIGEVLLHLIGILWMLHYITLFSWLKYVRAENVFSVFSLFIEFWKT